MKTKFDIQFFGSRPKPHQFRKRDPESPELTDLRRRLYEAVLPGIEAYDPESWKKAQQRADAAMDQQKALLDLLPGALDRGNGVLDEMLGVIRSGNIPSGLTDRMNASVNKGLQTSMGAMLNDLGNRGVLNSSITSQGVSRLGQQAADAFNRNYQNAFNSVIQGYGLGLQGAHSNAGNLLRGVEAVGRVPTQAFEGAGSALMPAFNLWKAMQDSYDRKEDFDTAIY